MKPISALPVLADRSPAPQERIAGRDALGRVRRCAHALALSALAWLTLSGCAPLQMYKTEILASGATAPCSAPGAPPSTAGAPPCNGQATERNELYTLHVVEFDDEGWPFEPPSGELSQIDSAIDQVKQQLRSPSDCVRLFVYVHGWRHNASPTDTNLSRFRELLAEISARSRATAASGADPCEDQTVSPERRAAGAGAGPGARPPGARSAVQQARTVGIYVGWRGLSIANVEPLVYASFWDRKNTAERVSQGSVRELFGRLSGLASYAPATRARQSVRSTSSARLRTYVIGHSFGASITFRALSQSLINSFAEDLETDESADLASVSRFIDMLVLVNPAIEAARFDPVFRAAQKRAAYCKRNDQRHDQRQDRRNAEPAARCDQPPYQAPVLAIFTSEGDQATRLAFPLGAALSTTFERTVNEAQRRAIVETIGWNDDYKTHRLAFVPACEPVDALPYAEAGDGVLRYRPLGWAWCFQEPGLTTPLSIRSEAGAPYNGPLWNIRVARDVMKDHGDIWNDTFQSVLLRLFTEQRAHPLTRDLSAIEAGAASR